MDTHHDLAIMLPNINPYIRPKGTSLEEWCDAKILEMEETILSIGADQIGCFIAEPILASGGVIVPPPGYHQRSIELCQKHNIIYISDETVTGFGRLGHWFASKEIFDIQPDIITCAKGLTSGYLPMGAAIISDGLIDDIKNIEGSQPFTNGYTYSCHPVAAKAALTNIDIISRDGILEHVREISPHFQNRLRDLGEKYDIIGDARGVGLLGCLEGVGSKNSSEKARLKIDTEFGQMMDEACEKRGLLVRPIINMCVFSPPLIISRSEIDQMFDILEDAIVEVHKNFT
jgi:adenosylmethionine-8-amino-7-oxononanoate aminotransferase